jgi:hypothetical protein
MRTDAGCLAALQAIMQHNSATAASCDSRDTRYALLLALVLVLLLCDLNL